jgi:hypothetical protein
MDIIRQILMGESIQEILIAEATKRKPSEKQASKRGASDRKGLLRRALKKAEPDEEKAPGMFMSQDVPIKQRGKKGKFYPELTVNVTHGDETAPVTVGDVNNYTVGMG